MQNSQPNKKLFILVSMGSPAAQTASVTFPGIELSAFILTSLSCGNLSPPLFWVPVQVPPTIKKNLLKNSNGHGCQWAKRFNLCQVCWMLVAEW